MKKQGECKWLCAEDEGKDLTDKKVGGCGGMRRGIWGWEGGRPLIRGGHIGCSGADPTSSNGSRIASH